MVGAGDDKVELVLINGRRAVMDRPFALFLDRGSLIFAAALLCLLACGAAPRGPLSFADWALSAGGAMLSGAAALVAAAAVCGGLAWLRLRAGRPGSIHLTAILLPAALLAETARQIGLGDPLSPWLIAAKLGFFLVAEALFAVFVLAPAPADSPAPQAALPPHPQPRADTPAVTDAGQIVRFGSASFNAADIRMITAHQHYIDIVAGPKTHRLRFRLKDAAKLIPPQHGWLANRSTWVAYHMVTAAHPISDGRVALTLTDGEMVVIPRGRSAELQQLMQRLERRPAV